MKTKLYILALDLRHSSNFDENELWEKVEPELWKKTRNPWMVFQTLSDTRLQELEKDSSFKSLLESHIKRWKDSLQSANWFSTLNKPMQIAYFSMEFGLSEALPIYSGGLGLLAGDYLKTCNDLGIPVTAIGLLYQQGYFRQEIDPEGKQIALYPFNEPGQLPIEKLHIRIPMEFPGRIVILRVYKAVIGNISLYLLDSNDLLNEPTDRGITSELYGGDQATRLKQEVILGIGGVRLLEALGIKNAIYHLNEGHAAFATIERARLAGGPFKEAFEEGKKHTLFTTHTPVEAGFDRFPIQLMQPGFSEYVKALGISFEEFLALGQFEKEDPFNMAYLAVRGSQFINGVSKLHGEVSQKLFEKLNCKVGYITNGVHIPSWESPEADHLWSLCSDKNRWYGTLETLEKEVHSLPDEELWNFRNASRKKLITYTRERIERELTRRGVPFIDGFLNPDILTIGFSRRFATYKRTNLLLHDKNRLKTLLKDKKIQLIIAGKSHPADEPGGKLIQEWIQFINDPEVRPYAVFLSDYDILVAERLVQGMDLWMNTPKRPWEASGTSGMKVLVNGGLNFSSLDGWWAEAYTPEVGWSLKGEDAAADAQALYDTLEKEIIPLFYERDEKGIPRGWLKKVKESMAHLTPKYSTNRMVRDYVQKYYLEMTYD